MPVRLAPPTHKRLDFAARVDGHRRHTSPGQAEPFPGVAAATRPARMRPLRASVEHADSRFILILSRFGLIGRSILAGGRPGRCDCGARGSICQSRAEANPSARRRPRTRRPTPALGTAIRCRRAIAPRAPVSGALWGQATRWRRRAAPLPPATPSGLKKMVPSSTEHGVEIKSQEPLPNFLPGVVCKQFVRCGRSNCRCAAGELHGPYFYRFWREGGRLRKAYVNRSDLDAVRARCAARQQQRRQLTAGWQEWRSLMKLLRDLLQR